MNTDVDASAIFELDADALTAGLEGIAAKFETVANVINSSFANANAQLVATASNAQAVGTASTRASAFAGFLSNAANAGRLVATTLGNIVTGVKLLAPWIKHIPDSWGTWVPKLKEVAAEHVQTAAKVSLVTKAAAALTGRLSVLSAGFAVLELRQLGASRAASVFGAAGGLALSKMIVAARGATAGIAAVTAGLMRAASSGIAGAFGSIGRSVSSVSMVAAPMAGLALSLGPIGAAAVGVAAGFGAVKKSVAAAAEVQGLQMSFVTLLGSADAAQKRMAELSKFAATTPFEIPGVVNASKVLETLTAGALSTGAGLRMVGDAAAVSQQPFDQLAVHIGRLYDGLKNGRPVGEAMSRLQELGLITSNTRAQLEAMQASGQKGDAVWKVAAASLGRFSGEMERQSGTWSGLLSNLSDTVGNLFRSFGAPIITSLTPFLSKLIDWIGSLSTWAEKAGSIFAGWSALIAQAFTDGQLTTALALAGKVGFLEALNYLLGGLNGLGGALIEILGGAGRGLLSLLQFATTADFWKGLTEALASAGSALIAMIEEGAAKLLDAISDLPGVGDYARKGSDFLHNDAAKYAGNTSTFGAMAGADLSPIFSKWSDDLRETMEKTGAAFSNGFKSGKGLLDVSGARAELAEFLRPLAARTKATVDAAAANASKGGLPAPIGNPEDVTAGKKGKAASDVAGLQKIGGGGGFSITKADPLLAETKTQTAAVNGMRSDIRALKEALTKKSTSVAEPVFR